MSRRSRTNPESEVLVVGAGPTGMVLASELQRHGMHGRIIDRLPQPSQTSKALGIQARTLELFEKMGVVESFLDKGVKLTAMNIYSNHRRIAQIRMQSVSSRYSFLLSLPQWETETILNAHLKQQGMEVERGVALTALQPTERGMNVVLEHADGQREEVHTHWLIGCDGPHSTVRNLLGLQFEGWTFEQSFALADVHLDCHLPVHQASFFWQEGDFIACIPLPQGQYRLIIAYRPQTGPEGDVTLEELQQALEKCGWTQIRVNDMVWSSRFHVNQRKVRHYHQGSVFLAGDACHIHYRPLVSAESVSTHPLYDENAVFYRAYGISDDGLVLVRPDGYIGFLCRPVSLEHLWAYLESIFVPSQTSLTNTATRSEVESRR